jgi:hypothetical protein
MNPTKNPIEPKLYMKTKNLIDPQVFSGDYVKVRIYQVFNGVHLKFRFYQVFSGVHVMF